MSLTLGLELEAVITALKSHKPIPFDIGDQLEVVSRFLEDVGLDAQVFLPDSAVTHAHPDYHGWTVTTDHSVRVATPGSENYDVATLSRIAMELISPVFNENSVDEWKDEVRLSHAAIDMSANWKCNGSTGLHVHIGRGNNWFTLPELKRLAILVIRFEDAVDTLHPPHRVSGNFCLMSNRHNAALDDLTLQEVYARIQGATDVRALLSLVNHVYGEDDRPDGYNGCQESRLFKVNFTAVRIHQTVEFRQHEGTVSAEIAIAWAEFLLRFVNFALSTTDDIAMADGESIDDLRALVPLP